MGVIGAHVKLTIRKLINRPSDLNEALHNCNYGLSNSDPTNLNGLIAAGQWLEADTIRALVEAASR